MGTLLQSLAQRQDGVLLFESFEASTFLQDQNWGTINGTPSQSQNVALDGIYSLALDSTCPLIQNVPAAPFTYCAAWFYDTLDTTAGCSPMISASAGVNTLTVGVLQGFGTYYILSPVVQDTKIPRINGFVRFSISPDVNGFEHVYINNTDTGYASPWSAPFTVFRLGCLNNTGDGFGYFDWVQINSTSTLTMYNLTDPQGFTLICGGAAPQATSSDGIAVIDMSKIDSPAMGYLTVQPGNSPNAAPIYQSDVLEFNAGDIYFLNQVRFNRRPTMLSVMPTQSRTDQKAVDGQQQSMFFYDADVLVLTISGLTEDQKNSLLSWWTTAKRGETFSVAVEESDIYLDFTQAAVTAFPTGQLVTAYQPPAPGKVVVVQSSDGTIKEACKIASHGSYSSTTGVWTCNLVTPQAEAVTAGLQVRALYYYPFCQITDKALKVTLSDAKIKRWQAQISFTEAIQAQDFMDFYAGLSK